MNDVDSHIREIREHIKENTDIRKARAKVWRTIYFATLEDDDACAKSRIQCMLVASMFLCQIIKHSEDLFEVEMAKQVFDCLLEDDPESALGDIDHSNFCPAHGLDRGWEPPLPRDQYRELYRTRRLRRNRLSAADTD